MTLRHAVTVLIVVDNKVPGYPHEALASWQGGVLITDKGEQYGFNDSGSIHRELKKIEYQSLYVRRKGR